MDRIAFYYAPIACSMAVHIALEEAGVDFEPHAIDLAKGEQSSPDYLRINPAGRVPAMIIDGQLVTEVPALLTYAASLNPAAGLIPPPATFAYARCFEWLGFLSSSLHVAYAQFRRPQRFIPLDSPCVDAVVAEGREISIRLYRDVERRLEHGSSWAAGDDYSLADIYLFLFFTWAWRLDLDLKAESPRWADLFERVKARPAVQRVIAREGLDL